MPTLSTTRCVIPTLVASRLGVGKGTPTRYLPPSSSVAYPRPHRCSPSPRVARRPAAALLVPLLTGRNFFPSEDLSCVFRNEDGTTGAKVPAKVIDASYTKLVCPAPTMDPHAARDCTNPALCQGTVLVVTNDGFTVGPQYLGPKWDDTANSMPAYMGLNPMKFLFTDIFVSPSGSDTVGDGTRARPYATIQRGVDAANEYDQLVLMPGYYTGLGNRGLRHHGKRIQLRSEASTCSSQDGTSMASDGDLQNTVIDCQHAPDGFILNNNKDSDSPFAGYIDTQDIITKNCENLRIYDI